MEASCTAVAPAAIAGDLTASDVLSDGTTTDESGGQPAGSKKERLLRQNRASYRRRVYAAIAAEIADGEKRTFLETHAVQRKTRAKYKAVLEQCRR